MAVPLHRVDNYSLCVSLYCMYYPTKQTVAGLLVLLADRAASVCLWDLHIGPWWFKLSEARRCHWLYVHACGAGENVFHTRGDRRQEGAPREPARGDRRRAVLDSFEQLQIDFQAKHICIRKTVLRAIWVSCGMCALNRWIIFLELSCRNFSPLNWDLGHYSACFCSRSSQRITRIKLFFRFSSL